MPIINHSILGRIAFPDGTNVDAIKSAIAAHLSKFDNPEDDRAFNQPPPLFPAIPLGGPISKGNYRSPALAAPMGIVQGETGGVPTAVAERLGAAPRGQAAWEAAHPIQPEDKGLLGSGMQALGFPTTMPEAQAMQDEFNPFNHPSNILGPMAPMIRGYGQNVGQRLQNMYHESVDAGENIAHGQTVAQNVGKAGLSGLQALFSLIPGVGENANTLGMQVAQGNNSGATGTMLGTLLPFAAGAVLEKPNMRLGISPKTLPTSVPPTEFKPFDRPFMKQTDVPQMLRDHVTNGGGEYKGAMEGTNLLFFNDPETRSTLAMPSYLIDSPDAVAKHMRMSRGEFAIARARAAGSK